MFKKILVPIDGVDVENVVIEVVKDYIETHDSEVVIFNCQDVLPSVYWMNDPVAVKDVPYDPKTIAEDIVSKVKDSFGNLSDKIETKTEIGDPATEILNTAEAGNFDLIVMCTHGMSATKRFLLGSVTNKVVHHAKIPVLVVR